MPRPLSKPSHPAGWRPSKALDRGSAAEQVVEDLREQILSGQLPRGSKLPTEKQLADAYGVSGTTIREATRGLTTARLIDVRHGSGAYVTAQADELLAISLRAMIQMERIDVPQVLGLFGAMNGYAAELAASRATSDDVAAMRAALDDVDHGATIDIIATGLIRFIDALSQASGNPLLATLCHFLTTLQVSLGRELCQGSLEQWRKTTRKLMKERRALAEAVAAHAPDVARTAARAYHERSLKVIGALPNAGTLAVSDPLVSSLLAATPGQGK